jgi:hypothetical protein
MTAPAGRYVQADRAAAVTLVNGRLIVTSDWVPLGAPSTRTAWVYAYDCFEDAGTGFPTDDAGAGCTAFLPSDAGNRWFFGNTYNNPFASNDMVTDPAGAGKVCERILTSWNWNIDEVGGAPYDDSNGDGFLDQDGFIGILSTDTISTPSDATVCDDDGTTSVINGVVIGFTAPLEDSCDDSVVPPVCAGYYFTDVDLTGSGLSVDMPADGSGGTIIIIGSAFDPGTGAITITGGPGDIWAQPMLWGTGEDEPGPSVRLGTQDALGFDDDGPTDGLHTLACFPAGEGYSYLYGICPDPLGYSLGLLYKNIPGCVCEGDVNGDGIVDISDLAFLLADFGSATPNQPCSDVNQDAIVDIADLALLLAAFGSACP